MNIISYNEFLASCCAISREAAAVIMRYYAAPFDTRHKEDKSPVTDADVAANTLIVNALKAMTPEIPIIAEEDEVMGALGHERFWLVDPLDGTRSFVERTDEFTVNIGLIENGSPVLGVIYAPVTQLLYFGQVGRGAFRVDAAGIKTQIHVRRPAQDGLVVVRSRSHPSAKTAAYLQTISVKELRPGSSSIKFCMVAEGSADIYPRFGRTMEWDTAAGHAILQAAGGRVETVDGRPFTYGKSGYENPPFIAYGF